MFNITKLKRPFLIEYTLNIEFYLWRLFIHAFINSNAFDQMEFLSQNQQQTNKLKIKYKHVFNTTMCLNMNFRSVSYFQNTNKDTDPSKYRRPFDKTLNIQIYPISNI